MSAKKGRLTIVQYAGDFKEASERLTQGGGETYRGQRYTVDYVERLTDKCDLVTTIAGVTNKKYDVTLASGARAIGAGFTSGFDSHEIVRLVAETQPDLLIVRSPIRPLLAWAIRHRCRTLLLLADSFNPHSLRSRLGQFVLSLYLRFPVFDVVANHGRAAAEQLVAAGVPARKVIAWDYPAFDTPKGRPPKTQSSNAKLILYAGMLIADKGVDDLISAAELLKHKGQTVRIELIGGGELPRIKALIYDKGLDDTVFLLGVLPNTEVMQKMVAADVIVIPSRYAYPEGMPLTIYEAYCSRTPLVVSDHPMFEGTVVHEKSGLVFHAGDSNQLASCIMQLLRDDALYGRLSSAGEAAWQTMQLPVKWDMVIDRWLDDSAESRSWIRANSLAGPRCQL